MHLKTIEDFNQYLSTKIPPKWLTAIVVHHTLVPDVHEWRGKRSFDAILRYYKMMGWTSYPHIFVATDGNWVMNDVTRKGTASNAANDFSIAVEVLGNYDRHHWQEPIKTSAVKTIAALLKWANLDIDDILTHRLYNPSKTCPGKAISLASIKALVLEELYNKKFTVIVEKARIRQGPSLLYPYSDRYLYLGDTFISSAIKLDEKDPGYAWAHVTKGSSRDGVLDGIGFVRTDLLNEG